MTSEQEPNSGDESDLEPISEELQDITTEELVESDYEVVPTSSTESGEGDRNRQRAPGRRYPPGRTHHDDSISSSSEDPGGNEHEDAYSAGYDSPMATRIGDEGDSDEDAERLRELHEGRHRSDGNLSTRQSSWDKRRVAEAICSSLPLAANECEMVLSVVESIDFSKFGQQKGLEGVTLGIVAVVVDERHRQRDDVEGEIVSFTDEYRRACNSVDVSMSDLATIKDVVREALDAGDVVLSRGKPRRDIHLPEPTPTVEYPREYWEERSSQYWARIAKDWSKAPDDFREAIPEEYRSIIEGLRRWEPWEDENDSADSDEDAESVHEKSSGMDDIEGILDELEAEFGDAQLDELNDKPTE